MKYARPKGTFDILPRTIKEGEGWKEAERWHHLESTMRTLAREYGYREIRTPIFEQTELFAREIGETSDIVFKEMYTFMDKAGRSMSLRPEGTAPVARAFVQNQLQQLGDLHKFFYVGPFFRYDRPQAGRYRQLHQFGIEAIGDKEPEQDFEVVKLFYELYSRLGISNLQIVVNSVGDRGSRDKYKEVLRDFLRPHLTSLSKENRARFIDNPLRILDSKDQEKSIVLKKAPSILDFIPSESMTYFDSFCALLKRQKIPFSIDPYLVRGLDYYNGPVFEIVSETLEGAQNTIGAGGRYDGLLTAVEGPNLPCVGGSTGIERILHTMEGQQISAPKHQGTVVTLISLGEAARERVFELLYELRHKRISSEMIVTGKIQKALRLASKNCSSFAIILGEEELSRECAQVKAMESHTMKEVDLGTLVEYVTGELSRGL